MSEMDTSTVEAPRDSSGQFTGGEEKFGIEGVEADQGYTHVNAPAAPTDDSPEAVYEQYKRKRGDADGQPIKRELTYADTGEKVEPNLAITPEQAHAALTQSYSFEQAGRELLGIEQTRDQIDRARAERINGDPKLAEHYGVDLEADTAPASEARSETPAEETYVAPADGEIHPEVQKALKHPQVRQAIAEEFTRAEQATQAYSTGLESARLHTLATLGEVVPHLMGLQPAQFEQGMELLAQVDPPAFQKAMNILARTNTIVQAQQQAEQHRAAVEHQQVETWAKAEDARLKTMGVEITNDVANEVADYAKSLGIERESLGRAMIDHPILRSAEVQAMMVAAAKFHAIQKAPAKAIPKPVPSVQRPGLARSPGDRDASEIMSLRQKATATGNAEDVFKLYKAKKARS
ncbi:MULTISPECIES: hypothetical protein [unclassified Bradyrhizobium]|uniref:hypothetical protein n=1 Tax=unclassified Bradyrhizobium TaxID=2631580 RepID=UPI001FF9028C|nr:MULTISPECIES: hypothetical protein [unclassified Bradyrhizobium]MCK1304704.1 hypothetical protein [Bradyrhizobium sp. 45]MCK1608577.1 hypothetical protein [Bradyrhizobium sp. 163]MCK1766349.1 hypothetical protein [Bradyrhizobium sp. 136]